MRYTVAGRVAAAGLAQGGRPGLLAGWAITPAPHALVAQLDRASDFESEGRRFESVRARQENQRLRLVQIREPERSANRRLTRALRFAEKVSKYLRRQDQRTSYGVPAPSGTARPATPARKPRPGARERSGRPYQPAKGSPPIGGERREHVRSDAGPTTFARLARFAYTPLCAATR